MLSFESVNLIILGCCLVGLIYAIFNALLLSRVRLLGGSGRVTESYNKFHDEEQIPDARTGLLLEIGSYIERGANAFL